MTSREPLRELIQRDAILFGSFTLKSGVVSPYYFDLRRVTCSAAGAHLIGQLLWERCQAAGADAIAGPATAAIPLVGATLALAGASGHPEFRGGYVRSASKDHGTGQRTEGSLRGGDAVYLVEDTITSGGSLIDAANELRAAGMTICGAFVLVDRGAGGLEAMRAAGLESEALFALTDFDLQPVV